MIIIPDIHGRDFWEKPVRENQGKKHIIFLGDYLDPYDDEPFAPQNAFPQLEDIVEMKEKYPDTITLLLGNHDIHYLTEKGRGGRYDYVRGARIKKFFIEKADLFQLAYEVELGGKKILFTHAGVVAGWLDHNREYLDNATPETIGSVLNQMWRDHSSWPVLFSLLADVSASRWGRAAFGSPTWSDVDDMRTDAPELLGIYQIFGHSQQESEPAINEYFACLDVRRAFRLTESGTIEKI